MSRVFKDRIILWTGSWYVCCLTANFPHYRGSNPFVSASIRGLLPSLHDHLPMQHIRPSLGWTGWDQWSSLLAGRGQKNGMLPKSIGRLRHPARLPNVRLNTASSAQTTGKQQVAKEDFVYQKPRTYLTLSCSYELGGKMAKLGETICNVMNTECWLL